MWEILRKSYRVAVSYILPIQQVQASQFSLHISYFLQNCKKGKSSKKDLPYSKTISQQFFIDMILVFYCSKHKFRT